MGKVDIIHKWNEPKEVSRYVSKDLFKLVKNTMPRTLLLAGVILLSVYLFIRSVLPDDIVPRLSHAFVGAFVVGILLYLLIFISGVLRRFGAGFIINDKKIINNTIISSNFIPWKDVTGYSVSEEEQFPEVTFIKIHPKKRRKMVLSLPKGELSEQVIKTFNERCSLIDDSESVFAQKKVLTDLECLYLLILSFVYSIAAAYLFYLYKFPLELMLIILVFGPGTLGCLLLCGTKIFKEDRIKAYALIFNYLGLALFFLCLALCEFYRWSKILKGS